MKLFYMVVRIDGELHYILSIIHTTNDIDNIYIHEYGY